jgi:hypothetical protein
MIDPENMMSKLAKFGLLGLTQDPDGQGHWRTDLGNGQVLVYGPNPDPPSWFWVIYDGAASVASGDEPGADAMAEHVRREQEKRGRLLRG